jgi:hypothetical protein
VNVSTLNAERMLANSVASSRPSQSINGDDDDDDDDDMLKPRHKYSYSRAVVRPSWLRSSADKTNQHAVEYMIVTFVFCLVFKDENKFLNYLYNFFASIYCIFCFFICV